MSGSCVPLTRAKCSSVPLTKTSEAAKKGFRVCQSLLAPFDLQSNRPHKGLSTYYVRAQTQIHKYTSTIHKYTSTNTQTHKHKYTKTNHKHKNTNRLQSVPVPPCSFRLAEQPPSLGAVHVLSHWGLSSIIS